MSDPINQFKIWYAEEKEASDVRIPAACCLSTLGIDGYPNARFLALKEVESGNFVVTGPMGGRKGSELQQLPKAALTFWWTATERQVRIQGDVLPISEEEADSYFEARTEAAKVVSQSFDQGQPLAELEELGRRFDERQREWAGQKIPRPVDWGGVRIVAVRIEFLDFKPSRLHVRESFERRGSTWHRTYLQP